MSENSKIEWCDHTFNPWVGCTKVGPGCDHCYAEAFNNRFRGGNWGPGAPRRRTSENNWQNPVKWNREAGRGMFVQCDVCGQREFRKWDNTVPPGGLACCSNPDCTALPESESSPERPRVFCASLADWLDNEVPIDWRVDLLDLIAQTPNLDWLLLTKRIGNWRDSIRNALSFAEDDSKTDAAALARKWLEGTPPPNVWLGATIVNQQEVDRDIPKLLAVPAAVRFLSMEPLLGPVDLSQIPVSGHGHHEMDPIITANVLMRAESYPPLPKIHWVIVGGESGTGARPMQAAWARSLRDQCNKARVPFLFKQWGEWTQSWLNDENGKIEGSEWMDRVGKKNAGRLLDRVEWTQFPKTDFIDIGDL